MQDILNPASLSVAPPIRSAYADDPDYRELIEVFLDAAPERARELRVAFDSGSLDHVLLKAHQLKGAAGGFGFQGLTELAAALERACRGGAREQIEAVLRETLDYMGRIAR